MSSRNHNPIGPRPPPRHRFDRHRPLVKPLLVGLAAALLAWAFIQIGSEMLEGDTHAIDLQVARHAQALRAGHPWLTGVMRDLSGLGSAVVLTLFTVATVVYLLLVRARAQALLVAIAVAGGSTTIALLKLVFGRLRPDGTLAEFTAAGLSFPSGHAGNSAIVFLTLGALLAGTRAPALERSYIMVVAALLLGLVGISRVLLGVHWASDVLAGWAFGAAWALGWLMLARRVTRKAGN